MNEGSVFVLLVLGPLALGVLGGYLRNRQRLRLLEMAHRERMPALEKGLPASDLPLGGEFDAGLDRLARFRGGLLVLMRRMLGGTS